MLTEHNEARGCAKLNLLRARTVFLATGKHEIHDWKRRSKESDSNELIGLKMHLYLDQQQQHQITGSVEIYFYNGGYAGLEPIEDNKVNLCFLINRKIYKSCSGNWDYILDWLYGISPYLKCIGTLGQTFGNFRHPLWLRALRGIIGATIVPAGRSNRGYTFTRRRWNSHRIEIRVIGSAELRGG